MFDKTVSSKLDSNCQLKEVVLKAKYFVHGIFISQHEEICSADIGLRILLCSGFAFLPFPCTCKTVIILITNKGHLCSLAHSLTHFGQIAVAKVNCVITFGNIFGNWTILVIFWTT